ETQFDPQAPRLSCSITDRSLKDSEPLVAHFLDLISLPDSRFEVTKVLDYLRLPALQRKFGFEDEDLDKIQWWLKSANIHWGLDKEHKASKLSQGDSYKQLSEQFTWQWGLKRLLKGYAFSDQETIDNNQLLLPHIEGQSAILLGRLMQLLEELQAYIQQLTKAKTVSQWVEFLYQGLNDFYHFDRDDMATRTLIKQVIESLKNDSTLAGYENKISYSVMRYYLQQSFIETGAGHQFLNGQITFCSMVPMRSIPFKVIAVLGLNDGQFPRQSIPLSFDLMSREPRREGDRSRRADDRYLFLEALISAREKLYLSYQGRDIRQNTEKQPSLILKELMVYLEKAYGWEFDEHSHWPFYQHGLHPFSPANYQGEDRSYDKSWLRFNQKGDVRDNLAISLLDVYSPSPFPKGGSVVDIEDLVKFFDNPLKVFAQNQLSLYFEQNEDTPEDIEPFDVNGLVNYQMRQSYCQQLEKNEASEVTSQYFHLSGLLPDSPLADEKLHESLLESESLIEEIKVLGQLCDERLKLQFNSFELTSNLTWIMNDRELLSWRPAKLKPKDLLRLWLMHLLATINKQQSIISRYFCFKDKTGIQQWLLNPISPEDAQHVLSELLNAWQQGAQQPVLVHAVLADALLKKNANLNLDELHNKSGALLKDWTKTIVSGDFSRGLDNDPYFTWFYTTVPDMLQALPQLYKLYQPLYAHLEVVK
ncbi:MAG: exodeoxyribonuclease V subunit gamma, partial [Gammaproteobacteria bacterium]|nr:exodeoxyribonuclease V subunit gamma [Gammaproteobacteria bacterium]